MNFLDRRFLNISLSVLAITNQPAANPTAGSQYIVGSSPSGAFASASANQIAHYDGSAWRFFTPKAGELEVLNLDSGEFLKFNGSAWTVVASLSSGGSSSLDFHVISIDGIAAGFSNNPSSEADLTPGNFLLTNNSVCYFNVEDDNPVNMYSHTWFSYHVSNGSSFTCWEYDNNQEEYILKLYTADSNSNNGWNVSDVSEGTIFFNRVNSCTYAYLNGELSKISNNFIVFDGFVTSGDSDHLPENPNQGDVFIPLDYLSSIGEEGPSLYIADNNNEWSSDYFPYWSDTRYVSTNHRYIFRYDSRSEDHDERAFYIHYLTSSDILFNLSESKFYRLLNGVPVCLNDSSQSSQAVSSYEPVAPVLAIVPTGSTLPATAATGDAFLNTSDAKLYTATAANSWDSGTLTANSSRYASSTDHKIYVSDGSALTASNIINGDLFLNKEDNSVYVYDSGASAFRKVGGYSISLCTESHSLNAAEVAGKSFTLSHNIASGQESNTLLFVSGIAQIVGVDFTASGNSISWDSKGLDAIGLAVGDTFLVQYIKV